MSKKKHTGLGGVESLFQSPEPAKEGQPRPQAQAVEKTQPDESTGTLRQTTVMLYDQEMDWLDQQVMEIRKNEGNRMLRKAAIIRALINLGIQAKAEVSGVQSEEELVERFVQAIRTT